MCVTSSGAHIRVIHSSLSLNWGVTVFLFIDNSTWNLCTVTTDLQAFIESPGPARTKTWMVVFRFNVLLKTMDLFSSAPLLPGPGTRICKNRKYTVYRSFPPLICSHQIDLINKSVESIFITERKGICSKLFFWWHACNAETNWWQWSRAKRTTKSFFWTIATRK